MAHTHYVAYPAILYGRENDSGTYTVTFPNIPGAISQEVGIQDALAKGAEALELMLYDEKIYQLQPSYQMSKLIIPKLL